MTTQELYGDALRLHSLASAAERVAADASRAALAARDKADVATAAFYRSQASPTISPLKGNPNGCSN